MSFEGILRGSEIDFLSAAYTRVSFKYDSFGRRIYKSSISSTSIYAYDGDTLAEETNSSGTVLARYSQGLNTDEPLALLRTSATSYYHADGLGTITSLSSGAGTLAQTYAFDSFGNRTAASGSLINVFQYTGREFDSETGEYYYRARYFDPSSGRFLNEDPIQFVGGINAYRYVSNNPTDLRDPMGLCPSEDAPDDLCKYAGRALDPSAYAYTGNATKYNPVTTYFDLFHGFAIGGYLDAQPFATGSVFQNADYGNYVYGAYMSANGWPLSLALAGADAHAWNQHRHNPIQYIGRRMDPNYPDLPIDNVVNITKGFNAQRNGTLCHKKPQWEPKP